MSAIGTEADTIAKSDVALCWYFGCIRIDNQGHVIGASYALWLCGLPALLFGMFWVITNSEERFRWSALDRPIAPGSHSVFKGLSFLGDTMVWPYFILVPLLLVLVRLAIGRTAALLANINSIVRPEFSSEPRAEELQGILIQAQAALITKCGPGAGFRALCSARVC
ncbi:MAG: hypothetical protein M3Z96_03015 [Pseudomonadota bacterium]|nr:hypothetical protein [Pseudomonadota bacterium]